MSGVAVTEMTASTDIAESYASPVIAPYVGAADSRSRRRWRGLIGPGTVAFCLIYGLAFGVLGPFIPLFFAFPIAILGLVAVWALPDARHAPSAALVGLLFAFVVALEVWPNYLALALPGLPWITMARLTGFPLTFVLLVCVSASHDFRARVAAALRATPWIWKLLVIFVVIQTVTVVFSRQPLMSVNRLLVAQTSCTAVFFASAFVFLAPGRVARMAAVLWVMVLAVCAIGFVEWRMRHLPWLGHIPSFLTISDDSVTKALAGQRRAAWGIYRVQSTSSTPLGLAEFLALSLPFVLNFAIGPYRWPVKLGATATIPVMLFIVFETGSRLGAVGCILTFLLYALAWGSRRWKERKDSVLAAAITFGYPAIFGLSLAATFAIGHLRAIVWQNGASQYSTDARKLQWHMGMPKILSHPWGYGIGMSGVVVGYYDQSGQLTIDSYYLSMLVDYGVIGFLVFYGMFAVSIFYSAKASLTSDMKSTDNLFLGPIAISLTNFFVIKSVFSQEDNHPLVFMMMGMVAALVARIRASAPAPDSTVTVRRARAAVHPGLMLARTRSDGGAAFEARPRRRGQ